MAQQLGQQPLVVLSEESQEISGEDARSMNVSAGQAVAEAVRTTLGPKGMDKMLLDSAGNVVVTNDGITILEEMEIEHPVANMVVEVADAQEAEVADGTTSAVVLAGELLRQAGDLFDQGLHPTTLVGGYRRAANEAADLLQEQAIEVSIDDDLLVRIASTAMTGKGAESASDTLAQLLVDAVRQVADGEEVDVGNVHVETVVGGAISDSELVDGVLVDKEPVHADMPLAIEDADVAIFDGRLEIRTPEIDPEADVSDSDDLQRFLDREEFTLREMVGHLIDVGADAVLVDRGIDDRAQEMLAREGIFALHRVSNADQRAVARATGARIVSDLEELGEDDLGRADTVAQQEFGGDTYTVIEAEGAKVVTLLLRGGTEHIAEEVERAVDDALGAVRVALEDGTVVPGGGAPETELALGVRDVADSVDGREQLAVEAFADALEVVPRTLAENAGLDTIDALVDLRNRHAGGETGAGLDAYTGGIVDMEAAGVVEPLRVKTQAVSAATEAAEMILRIDDVIAAGDLEGGRVDEEDDEDTGGPTDYGDAGTGGIAGAM